MAAMARQHCPACAQDFPARSEVIPYLAMEFVAGRKLTELVRPDTPLTPLRVATILLGIARGLAHAASRGHRQPGHPA